MPLRDIALTLFIFGALPFVFKRPYLGVLLWTWFGFMNPHRLTFGFANGYPFAAYIAAVTLVAVLISKEDKRMPWTPITVVLLLFSIWMTITTFFSLFDPVWYQWEKVMKILLMIFVTIMVMKGKTRINWLVWTATLSLGYYGIKGGYFTLATGGQHQVLGPLHSFIAGNTNLSLALVMTVPLFWYLRMTAKNRWVRHGLLVAVVLTVTAILGSYSRGAIVAVVPMTAYLWLKSSKKGLLTIIAIVAIPLAYNFMPQKWHDKMYTAVEYKQDGSAQGRFHAWSFAFNLAKDNPITGGGFETFGPEQFAIYAPATGFAGFTGKSRDAHSIYFEVLGEHGFVGLFLFLLLMWLIWRTGGWIIRNARGHEDLKWASDLAGMVQVSLLGYVVAGAFLGLAYFDLYYLLAAILVLTRMEVEKRVISKDVRISTSVVVAAGASEASQAGGTKFTG